MLLETMLKTVLEIDETTLLSSADADEAAADDEADARLESGADVATDALVDE